MSKVTTPVHNLIAHFLAENGYEKTLREFQSEHGQPIDQVKVGDESLTDIISDRINFNQLAPSLENLDIGNRRLSFSGSGYLKSVSKDQLQNWVTPFPHLAKELVDIDGMVISTSYLDGCVYFSTNNSQIYIVDDKHVVYRSKFPVVIKKIIPIKQDQLLLVGMSGMFYLYFKQNERWQTVVEFPVHKRLIIDAKHVRFNDCDYIVTLGWDFYLKVIKLEAENKFTIVSEFKLNQQGTCFDLINHNNQLLIVVGKLDNTLLDVFELQENKLELLFKISLNDAEFSASEFSPRYITIQHFGSSVPLIAVATSHEPYMRLIVVTLDMIEGQEHEIKRNQIVKNLNTMSPQDKFSQPIIAWRLPKHVNGADVTIEATKSSGIWIMGDDGVIRGIDLVDDKVVVELKDVHQGKIKDFL
ncbi:uncharacterized protein SPAPADRAFT_62700, partial [Spathaspora passalidarum NRRL Y-27907]